MLLRWIFTLWLVFGFTRGEEHPQIIEGEEQICFRKVGCFSLNEPWKSTLRPLPAPMSPDKVGTRVYLYQRPGTKIRNEIILHPKAALYNTTLDRSKPTAIITHGFAANGNSSWIENMKEAYLESIDGNVLVTDWGPGASFLNYLQVSSNTRVVAAELAKMIKALNLEPGKIHLIGHSLGSHISAYVGKAIPGIARLTALDPAQPAFEGFSSDVRLNQNDAQFVDVIHTDARPFIPTLGFGMMSSAGHVDFYVNGGFDQPGCIIPDLSKLSSIKSLGDLVKFPVEVIADIVTCPHGRAQEYFTESMRNIDKCIFWGHKASAQSVLRTITNTVTQGVFKKIIALSSTCSREDCTPMGFRTKLSPLRGTFVVTTNGKAPYCISEPGVPPETAPKTSKLSSISKAVQAPISTLRSVLSFNNSTNGQ